MLCGPNSPATALVGTLPPSLQGELEKNLEEFVNIAAPGGNNTPPPTNHMSKKAMTRGKNTYVYMHIDSHTHRHTHSPHIIHREACPANL